MPTDFLDFTSGCATQPSYRFALSSYFISPTQMNKTKIARYYPLYLDMLRTKAAHPQRTLLSMMENQLRAETLLASPRRYWVGLKDCDNPQQRFDHLGCVTDELLREFVPARVFNWAHLQLLTLPTAEEVSELLREPICQQAWLQATAVLMKERTGWQAYIQASTPIAGVPGQPAPSERETTQHVRRQGTAQDFAPLIRGLRAHQAKQRRRAQRLLAQLWTYHWQQQVTRQLVTVEAARAAEGGLVA